MRKENEQNSIQQEQALEMVEAMEQEALVKWYRRWRNEPWTYAVVSTLAKAPFYLLILAVVRWEKIKPFFTDPFLYLKEKSLSLLVAFFLFTIIYHFAWKAKALKYYLLAKIHPRLQLRDDDRVGTYSRKASKRLVVQYNRWGQQRWRLAGLMALLLPVAFFTILYLIHGLKEKQWSLQVFTSIFESGTDVAVFAIFFLFGVLLGNGIWKEINQNFHLLQKSKGKP